MENSWEINTENSNKIKKTQKYLSISFGVIGILVILSQVIPLTKSYIEGRIAETKKELIADPVPESYKTYIEEEFAYYDPGKSYFANLTNSIDDQYTYDPTTNSQKKIVVDLEYANTMYLTIEDIGIEHIQISPNVESSDEKIYNQYLKNGLAHFRGTPLPGDGGNTFVYGHSAVESFFNAHKNLPETIFSRLDNVDIGQTVDVEKDGEILEYTVRNKKIVNPDDFSIMQAQGDKETITMMTCWPLGIGTKRLIVVAERDI
jgi:LPXTG-site transpeptidase (sortase) family protein